MDLGSILVIMALAVVVIGYIIRPLLEKRGFSVTEKSRHISELQAERDRILMVLQELDMDHTMGKVSTQDYESQRPGLVARGADVLRELDQLGALFATQASLPSKSNGQDIQDLDAMIEEEIQRRRKSSSVEKSGFCTQCGNPLQSGDHFCTSCGAKIEVVESRA